MREVIAAKDPNGRQICFGILAEYGVKDCATLAVDKRAEVIAKARKAAA
jgi:hypothetical protein